MGAAWPISGVSPTGESDLPRSLVRVEDEAGRDWEERCENGCSLDDAGSHGTAPGLREKCGLMLARESGSSSGARTLSSTNLVVLCVRAWSAPSEASIVPPPGPN